MVYTKLGPFVDGGAPYLSGANLTAMDAGILAGGALYTLDGGTPGIDWTGTTDSSAALNALLASAPTGTYGNLIVKAPAAGRIRIDSTITIDLTRLGIDVAGGHLTLDATHINTTTGTAVQITATAAVPNNAGYGGPKIGPFRLIGPGRGNTGTTGIRWTATTASGGMVRNVTLDHVSVEEFGVLETYGDNTFCVGHDGCVFKGGGTYGTWMPSTTTNTGERIVYLNCTWQEIGGIAVQNDGGELTVIGGSVDYDTGVMVAVTGIGVTEFYATHFEKSIVDTDYWFTLTGGNLKVFGGKLVGTGTYAAGTAPAAIVHNTASPTYADGTALFDGVTMSTALQTSTGIFADGGGTTIVRDHSRPNQFQQAFIITALENNLLSNGGFENTTLTDTWFLSQDSATITASTRTTTGLTGTGGNLATSVTNRTGAASGRFTKTTAAGSALEFTVVTPIRRQSVPGVIGYLRRNTTLTGSFTIRVAFCTVQDEAGVLRTGNDQTVSTNVIDTVTTLPAANTWYPFTSSSQVRRAPAWATHVAVKFDFTAMGAGAVLLDDLCITDS